jgi:hypothetical protein
MVNQSRGGLRFWLQERIRDLLIWPVSLVSDFPVRAARLLLTLWSLITGVAGLPAALFMAGRSGDFSPFLRRLPGRIFHWLHRLLNQLFDLAGGPELVQILTHLIANTTPLTAEEIALAVSVIGPDRMRFHRVRVAEGGLQDLIFKYNGNLAYTTWHTIHFPRDKGGQSTAHSRANLSILIHELTHVYQYEQVGSRYLGEAIYMLVKTRRRCYDYGSIQGLRDAHAAGRQYRDFNREQQAQIVQDYFALRHRGGDVAAHELFIAQMRAGQV